MTRNDILSALAFSLCLILFAISWRGGFEVERSISNILTTSIIVSICGDGIVQAGGHEVCDDGTGNNTGAYASSTAARTCAPGCLSFGPYCGDDILQVRFNEECDDGNNTNNDLCSATCGEEEPPEGGGGLDRGYIPSLPAPEGNVSAKTETRVVVKGKAYPSAVVHILLDGQEIGTPQSDTNADFQFSSTDITAGKSTFGFWALDSGGVRSITFAATFEVLQSAITTVNNVLIPPSISVGNEEGETNPLLVISGQSVPLSTVFVHMAGGGEANVYEVDTSAGGTWALQLDTAPLSRTAQYSVKANFEKETPEGLLASGFSNIVNFKIGDTGQIIIPGDLNRDGRVNLTDFSILLFYWGSDDAIADINSDGTVNLTDFSIQLFNWTG